MELVATQRVAVVAADFEGEVVDLVAVALRGDGEHEN